MKLTQLTFLMLFATVLFTASIQVSFIDIEDLNNVSFVEEENQEEDFQVEEKTKAIDEGAFDFQLAVQKKLKGLFDNVVHKDKHYELVHIGVPYSPPEI